MRHLLCHCYFELRQTHRRTGLLVVKFIQEKERTKALGQIPFLSSFFLYNDLGQSYVRLANVRRTELVLRIPVNLLKIDLPSFILLIDQFLLFSFSLKIPLLSFSSSGQREGALPSATASLRGRYSECPKKRARGKTGEIQDVGKEVEREGVKFCTRSH